MSGALVPGDRIRFSTALLQDIVLREFVRDHFYFGIPSERQVRVERIETEADGTKTIVVSNLDEEGKPLGGWEPATTWR